MDFTPSTLCTQVCLTLIPVMASVTGSVLIEHALGLQIKIGAQCAPTISCRGGLSGQGPVIGDAALGTFVDPILREGSTSPECPSERHLQKRDALAAVRERGKLFHVLHFTWEPRRHILANEFFLMSDKGWVHVCQRLTCRQGALTEGRRGLVVVVLRRFGYHRHVV